MKNFHKNLNIAFIGGFIGMALMTWLAPKMIVANFTPPEIADGNCAPIGNWLMSKLVICQVIGLVVFIPLTFWVKYKLTPKGS
jgi:hypothetical protein